MTINLDKLVADYELEKVKRADLTRSVYRSEQQVRDLTEFTVMLSEELANTRLEVELLREENRRLYKKVEEAESQIIQKQVSNFFQKVFGGISEYAEMLSSMETEKKA